MTEAQRRAAAARSRSSPTQGFEPDRIVLDGKHDYLGMPRVVRTIVKGDQKVLSVAAASVVAKTTRDAMMAEEAEHYPAYGFESNRGYPAPLHKCALAGYGPSAIHRRSWIFMDYCVWGGIPRFERQPTLFSSRGCGAMPDAAWDALAAHADADARPDACASCSRPSPTATQMHVEAAGWYLDYAKHRVDAETLRLLLDLAEARGLRARIDAMFRGDHVNVTEDRAVLHVALRMPAAAHARRRRGRRRGRGAARAAADVGVRRLDPRREPGRPHRPADPQRREHRHRRQRPRARDGVRRAARVQPARHAVPVRVERRRRRSARGAARPRRGRDVVHRLVEDVHDAGDADQRARGARVAGRRAGRRRRRGRAALRRGVDERGEGRRVRDRHREHVRVLGLGRRPLLDVVGDRAVVDARDRAATTSASCSRARTRWTSTSAPRRSRRTCP